MVIVSPPLPRHTEFTMAHPICSLSSCIPRLWLIYSPSSVSIGRTNISLSFLLHAENTTSQWLITVPTLNLSTCKVILENGMKKCISHLPWNLTYA